MSINDYLTLALAAAATVRFHWLPVAVVSLYLLHIAVDPHLSATAYYGMAAIIDCLVVGLCWLCIRRESPPAWVFYVAYFSAASVAVNAVGWGLWYYYQPPAMYNWGMTVVYLGMIFAFLYKGPGRGHRVGILAVIGRVRGARFARRGLGRTHKGSA